MNPYNTNPSPPYASAPRNTEPSNNKNGSSRLIVDHTYRDFSCFLLKGGDIPRHKKSGANFPAKLHQMLSDDECSDIITWMPHGRAFKILDKELLVSFAVPKYLSQRKFESFTRQLSGWGFKRLHQSGPDYGSYYHECFLRGIPLITGVMRRAETNQGKPFPNPEEEPNFYYISSIYPLPPTQDGGSLTSFATLQAGDMTTSFSLGHSTLSGHTKSTYQSLSDMQYNATRMRSTSASEQHPTPSLAQDSSSTLASVVPNMHCNENDNAAHQNPMVYSAWNSAMFAEVALPIEASAFEEHNPHHHPYQISNNVQQANVYHGHPPTYSNFQQNPMYTPYPPVYNSHQYYGSGYPDNSTQDRDNIDLAQAPSSAPSRHVFMSSSYQNSSGSSNQGGLEQSIPTTAQLDSNASVPERKTDEEQQGTLRNSDFENAMNAFFDSFDV